MEKNKILIGAICCLAVVFAGCDDFLDSDSKSSYSTERTFSSVALAEQQILSLYNGIASTEIYGSSMFYFKCDSDVESLAGVNDGSSNSIAHYEADPGTSLIAYTWSKYYEVIDKANVAIDELPKSPLWDDPQSEAMARRLYGEALTARALCYYEMIFIWGDIPFKTEPTRSGDNFYVTKTDRDVIYEHLVEDLKIAQEYVPWQSVVNTTERFTKGFVKGLRARLALAYAGYSLRNVTFETRRGEHWKEYYQIANTECLEIMESGQHYLNPSYEDAFRKIHRYQLDMEYGEVMFEVAFGRMQSGRVAQTIGMPHRISPPGPRYGRAAGFVATNPVYYYDFDTKDIRRDINTAMFNYSGSDGVQQLISITGFRTTKWRRMWIEPNMGGILASVEYTGVNWPLMRFSDILLMFAETENEINGGPTEAAKEALARVRERAFPSSLYTAKVTDYINTVSASKESFFNAIVDERAWEFGGELMRKHDLIRWNLMGEKLEELRDKMYKILYAEPPYDWVPDRIYWRVNPDGHTLEVYNSDFLTLKPSVGSGETEYSTRTWFSLLSQANKDAHLNTSSFSRIASGYSKELNNYLMPIAGTTISDSKGVLTNDQFRKKQ